MTETYVMESDRFFPINGWDLQVARVQVCSVSIAVLLRQGVFLVPTTHVLGGRISRATKSALVDKYGSEVLVDMDPVEVNCASRAAGWGRPQQAVALTVLVEFLMTQDPVVANELGKAMIRLGDAEDRRATQVALPEPVAEAAVRDNQELEGLFAFIRDGGTHGRTKTDLNAGHFSYRKRSAQIQALVAALEEEGRIRSEPGVGNACRYFAVGVEEAVEPSVPPTDRVVRLHRVTSALVGLRAENSDDQHVQAAIDELLVQHMNTFSRCLQGS